jgi:HPr kinase/phosphorylase
MVQLTREAPDVLVGKSPESLRYHMEIRGLGVLDIRSIFGAAGITDTKRVRLIVDLIRWGDFNEEDRLMANDECILHEVKLPRIRIPVRKGRSLAVLVEVAVRNQLLKQRGVHSSQAFSQALSQRIQEKT